MKRKPYKLMQKSPHDFANIQTFCLFVGFARSGHTLIGEILNAHPEVIIGRETQVLRLALENPEFSREDIFTRIMLHRAKTGNQFMGYDYYVPTNYGKSDTIKVLGDTKGRENVSLIIKSYSEEGKWTGNDILNQMRNLPSDEPESKPYRFRVFFWVRNPFDNIATIAERGSRRKAGADMKGLPPQKLIKFSADKDTLGTSINRYFKACQQNEIVLRFLDKEELFQCRHENFVAHPREILVECADFLGVEALPEWLDACVSIVNPVPHKSRHKIDWTDEQRQKVEEGIKRYDFLRGYSWDG